MADTLNPRPRRRNMLVLLGVLLLGVVAAAWGFWSRIRERHGRDNGWQHLRPASRPAPAAIPGSAGADPVAASSTAASPEPGPPPVPDNPPATEAAAELTPTPRPGHAVEPAAGRPAAGKPGPPELGAVTPARPEPRGANAALVGPDGATSAPPGSAPAPPAAQRPAPNQPADARHPTRSRAVPAASARTSVASAGLPSDALFGPGSVRARSDGSSPEPAYVVKGKIATKVFYSPGGAYYTRTRADVWFRTADDARAAGFTERAPRRHR
jgi:hypothetical protein